MLDGMVVVGEVVDGQVDGEGVLNTKAEGREGDEDTKRVGNGVGAIDDGDEDAKGTPGFSVG